jgi:hypothetical protein
MTFRACFLRLERDQEFRQRVLAACRLRELRDQARCAVGFNLDAVGEFVDVRRRIVEDVA